MEKNRNSLNVVQSKLHGECIAYAELLVRKWVAESQGAELADPSLLGQSEKIVKSWLQWKRAMEKMPVEDAEFMFSINLRKSSVG